MYSSIFDIHAVTTIKLISISITPHSYHFPPCMCMCLCDEKLKIYPRKTFEVHNTASLTMHTLLYIIISKTYSSCMTETLYLLTSISPFLLPTTLWQPPFYSLLLWLWLFWFIAALFTTAKMWKQPKCPSTDEWIKKIQCIYTMKYYLVFKKKEVPPFQQHG